MSIEYQFRRNTPPEHLLLAIEHYLIAQNSTPAILFSENKATTNRNQSERCRKMNMLYALPVDLTS